jgi:hypothetical protein
VKARSSARRCTLRLSHTSTTTPPGTQSFAVDSDAKITVTSPPGTVDKTGTRTVDITVTALAGTSAATAADQFTYYIRRSA